jgi:predicted butyrate kinase (DUF1464 family)
MAKITIAGDAVITTSSLSLEELKLVAKLRPQALRLMGGENNKEVVFAIGVAKGNGSINQYGASFAGETHDDAKLATITMIAEGVTGDVKEWAADRIGAAIININKIEANLPDVLAEIRTEKAAVLSNITVA